MMMMMMMMVLERLLSSSSSSSSSSSPPKSGLFLSRFFSSFLSFYSTLNWNNKNPKQYIFKIKKKGHTGHFSLFFH